MVGVNLTSNEVDAKLLKTGVTKRLKMDKVRKLLADCIVQLHGLVAAYKLNGELGQVIGFDVDMQRYEVQVASGEMKKVKPQNVKYVGIYNQQITNLSQIKVMREEADQPRQHIVSIIQKWNSVTPLVIAGRALLDWSKLDDDELRNRLMQSKKMGLETVPDNAHVVYLSIPRKRLIGGSLDAAYNNWFDRVIQVITPWLEDTIRSQLYFMLPHEIVHGSELPMLKRAAVCSFPLYAFVCDGMVVCTRKGDSLNSLRYAAQRMDVACANIAKLKVFVYQEENHFSGKSMSNMGKVDIKLSLPSRGRCDDDEIKSFQEIENSLKIEKPNGDDAIFFISSLLVK